MPSRKENNHLYHDDKKHYIKDAGFPILRRGFVCIERCYLEQIKDTAILGRTCQSNLGLLIESLEGIAFNKGILDKNQVLKMGSNQYYNEYLEML